MWIAFRTRPDICRAVSRVMPTVKPRDSEHHVDEKKRKNPNQTCSSVPCNDMELVFDYKAT
eukprot:12913712-Prorocentrum_lima.AAC.1